MIINNFWSVSKWLLFCTMALASSFVYAQQNSSMSITDIHNLAEKLVNYNPDSSLVLLDFAAKKIGAEKNKDLADFYWADNDLRRADYWLFDDPQKAQTLIEKSYRYFKNNVDNKKLAEIFCIKAQIIKIEGQMQFDAIQKSLPYFDTALTYALQQNAAATKAFIYYEKAITFQQADRWQESLESAFLATHQAELSGDSLSMAMAYFLMGRTYNHFGFSDKSQINISKAIDYGKGMFLISSVIYTYAKILLKNHEFDLALQNFKLALKLNVEQNRPDHLLLLYTSIGQLQMRLGNYEEAEKSLKAINQLEKIMKNKLPNTVLFSAQMHNYAGDTKKTLAELEEFKNIYKNVSINDYDIDVNQRAADLYFALGEPAEAAVLYKKWGTLKDSLQYYTNRLQLSELEKMYFNERTKNEEITLKNEEITLKNEELKKSRASQAMMGLLLFTFLLVGGGITYFIRMKGLKENQKLKDALKNKQLEQLMEGQETERQRLARELHDGIGQSLAALKIQLQFEDHHASTHPTVKQVDALCQEIRSISHQMMPLELKENGLKAAIKKLLESSFSNTGIAADLVCHGLEERLPDLVEIHLYRIMQELISNILKHAQATEVGVQLLQRNDSISLIVEDNGRGFNQKNQNHGIGISNMHSRIEALAGSITIQSSEMEGTFVRISIPFSKQFKSKTA